MRPIVWWGGLSRRRRLLVAVLALVVVTGGVVGTVRALAGSPAVTSANENHPGAVLLVPGYGGSTTALDQLAGKITASGGTLGSTALTAPLLRLPLPPDPRAQVIPTPELNPHLVRNLLHHRGNSVSYIQDQVTSQSNLEIIAEGSLMQPGNQALYTLPGSPVTNVTELKGKRIGVNALNNIGTLLISSVLEEYGMSPRAVHFVPVNFPMMGEALKRHVIDVAWLPEPFGSARRVWACRSFATSIRARRRTSRSDGTW